jgi:hypothetical protein
MEVYLETGGGERGEMRGGEDDDKGEDGLAD